MSTDPAPRTERMFYREAICRAVREKMGQNERVIVLGQDVGAFGGSYREFDGLYDAFGAARVRDTPVAESVMVGLGVGAAAAGFRPLVSITYMDFLLLGLDPLVNYGAKLRYKTAGQLKAPIIIKTTAGAKGQGVAHSQCIEAWLMGIPGLKVVAPSTPADAYGLMIASFEEEGPVVFVDHKRLFPIPGEVPLDGGRVPIGVSVVRRQGCDVTITTHSYMTRVALEAAVTLAKEDIACEVIDLRTLAPLDIETVIHSVRRTGALVTLEEGQVTCGVGAEIAAQVQTRLSGVALARVGALPAPVSSNPVLEAACIPNSVSVAAAVRSLLQNRSPEPGLHPMGHSQFRGHP